MALYGVIGDVHGNREALLAVLACCRERGVEHLICVGDIVGYNADPDECVALLEKSQALAVAGNHDLISVGELDFARCANKVIYSLKRTRRALAPRTLAYLKALPAHRIVESRMLVCPAGVRDIEEYLVTVAQVRRNAHELEADFPGASICLFGHVHTQKVYEIEGDVVRELDLNGPFALRTDRVYFINPGSVDAARKRGVKRAEYAVLDTVAWRIELHDTAYDDVSSEAKAAAGGYRIGYWTDRWYSVRRRAVSRLSRIVAGSGAALHMGRTD
jgi:predicted phosphodiesterase